MKFELDDKVALVLGGSSGIGLAIAQRLEAAGVKEIILVSRSTDKLATAKSTFCDQGCVSVFACDLSKQASVDDLIGFLERREVNVDILINNSGGPKAGDFFDTDLSDWQGALQSNFLSYMLVTKHCMKGMIEKSWGRVINISSTTAVEPTAGMIISSSIRAAVSAFSKSLSDSVADKGISINTICPGGVATDRLTGLVKAQAESSGRSYNDTLSDSVAIIPKKRFAEPLELASLAEYLCCEEAGYITGRVIGFDGGLMRSF